MIQSTCKLVICDYYTKLYIVRTSPVFSHFSGVLLLIYIILSDAPNGDSQSR